MARGSSFVVVLTAGLLALVAGCSRPITTTTCLDDRDCTNQVCSAGTCVDGTAVTSCLTDLDCAAGTVCDSGVCTAANTSSSSCVSTAECALDTFCNTVTGVCAPLLDGWCRADSQCPSTASICSNRETGSDTPGKCQQCLTSADCSSGETCNVANICESAGSCPDNAIALGDGTCRCDIGYVDDGAGGCQASVRGEGEGEGEGEGVVEPGEGEGEGEAGEGEGESVGSCEFDFECYLATDNPNYACDLDGTCVCDEVALFLFCDAYDVDLCDCVDPTTPVGGGCGDITYEGDCDGDVLTYCEGNEVLVIDCSEYGYVCDYGGLGADCY